MSVARVLAGEARWHVEQGNCLDVLRGIDPSAVALLCTDPPYGMREQTNRRAKGRSGLARCNDFPPVVGDDRPFDPAPLLAFPRVVLWGANHYADRLPSSPSWLVWDKRVGVLVNDNSDAELAWTNLGGPMRVFRHLWAGMLRASERDEARVHPTQKPVALFRWIIEAHTKPGDLVVDPYCGSGPCGVAAVALGRRYIGCDVVPEYAAIARERIHAAEHETTVNAVRAGQTSIFDRVKVPA